MSIYQFDVAIDVLIFTVDVMDSGKSGSLDTKGPDDALAWRGVITSSSDPSTYIDMYFLVSRGGDVSSGPEGGDDGIDFPLGARLRAVDALFELGELFLRVRVREPVAVLPRALTLFDWGDPPPGPGGGGGSGGVCCPDVSSVFKPA